MGLRNSGDAACRKGHTQLAAVKGLQSCFPFALFAFLCFPCLLACFLSAFFASLALFVLFCCVAAFRVCCLGSVVCFLVALRVWLWNPLLFSASFLMIAVLWYLHHLTV